KREKTTIRSTIQKVHNAQFRIRQLCFYRKTSPPTWLWQLPIEQHFLTILRYQTKRYIHTANPLR
ncbi:hypothetical protein COEREDRAFT_80557, partial [Coemansia reversa NRRL 1564]